MKTEKKEGYNLVRQENGPDLGYSSTSGVKIITVDGCAFKSFDGSDTLLPYEDWRLPADMQAVEEHCEDRPRDIRCYRDADGNVYDFAFGMNWKGVIDDERVRKYK